MPKPQMWSPELYDAALIQRGPEQILLTAPGSSIDSRILWARAALSTARPHHCLTACQLLAGLDDRLATGLYVAIASTMGEYEDALTVPAYRARAPREWDGLAWLHMGRSSALSARGEYTQALVELGKGVMAAEQGDVPGRAQLLEQHVRVIENRLNAGRPEAIEQDLKADMPAGRRAWHEGNLAAALLQRGQYKRASLAVRSGNHWHSLSVALQGGDVPHELRTPSQVAARTWSQAWNGRAVTRVTGVPGSLGQYATLAYGLDLSRTVRGAKLVPALLGDAPPMIDDLDVLWSGALLQAVARGADVPDPLLLTTVFNEALGALTHRDDVLALTARLMPEALAIVASGPRPHRDAVLAAHQLFARRGALLQAQVISAYAGQDVPSEPGRVPNLGAVMLGIERMIDTAQDQERTGVEQTWRVGREALLFDHAKSLNLPGIVRQAYHCLAGGEGRTLEA